MPHMPLKPEWGGLGTGWQVKPGAPLDPEKVLACFSSSLPPECPGCLGHIWWHATHASGGDMKWRGGGGGGR